MTRIRISTAIAVLYITLATSFGAQATGGEATTQAARQEFANAVQNFRLTPDFLDKWRVFDNVRFDGIYVPRDKGPK